MIVVLQGCAAIEVDGRLFAHAPAGSIAYLLENTVHNVINRSDQNLRYVYIVSPQGVDETAHGHPRWNNV